MNLIIRQRWSVLTFLWHLIRTVCPQIPLFPLMVPPPIQIIQVPVQVPTTSTTTTTQRTWQAIAVPLPVAMPMPMPMPVLPHPQPDFCQIHPRSPGCPPCPPCLCTPACTPSFYSFCSPCHQRCRCRDRNSVPRPLPVYPPPPIVAPVPMPPPIFVAPFPPVRVQTRCPGHRTTDADSSSDFSSDSISSSDSDDSKLRHGKRNRKRRVQYFSRKNLRRRGDLRNSEVVKPVLSYLNKKGDVKIQKRLTNGEAAELLNDKSSSIDQNSRRRLQVSPLLANEDEEIWHKLPSNTRRKQVILRNGPTSRILSSGKKELIFRPPGDKKITNLSVSFQVA